MIHNSGLQFITPVQQALDELSNKWQIPNEVYEMHLGLRDDVEDHLIVVNEVTFHIPKLITSNVYVLWNCLWPDCRNCCEQDRIPLTKNDIEILAKKLGYSSKIDFLKKEALISTWTHEEPFGDVSTTRSQICLKRKEDEIEGIDEGKRMSCRFQNDRGCTIHLDKPGACQVYPFVSYLEYQVNDNGTNTKPIIHALYQLTGHCPGFYLEKSLETMMPILKQYSIKIYDYNMAFYETKRQGYCVTSSVNLRQDTV